MEILFQNLFDIKMYNTGLIYVQKLNYIKLGQLDTIHAEEIQEEIQKLVNETKVLYNNEIDTMMGQYCSSKLERNIQLLFKIAEFSLWKSRFFKGKEIDD